MTDKIRQKLKREISNIHIEGFENVSYVNGDWYFIHFVSDALSLGPVGDSFDNFYKRLGNGDKCEDGVIDRHLSAIKEKIENDLEEYLRVAD